MYVREDAGEAQLLDIWVSDGKFKQKTIKAIG
jgi:hypothetical protein